MYVCVCVCEYAIQVDWMPCSRLFISNLSVCARLPISIRINLHFNRTIQRNREHIPIHKANFPNTGTIRLKRQPILRRMSFIAEGLPVSMISHEIWELYLCFQSPNPDKRMLWICVSISCNPELVLRTVPALKCIGEWWMKHGTGIFAVAAELI